MTNILVAYSSKYNSTAEIAKAIGEVIIKAGLVHTEVRPVEVITDVKGYDVVILGSAVYAGQWQPAAAAFLQKHQEALAKRRVWLFSSGPVGSGDLKTLLNGWEFPEVLLPFIDRIKPRDITVFQGSINPDSLNRIERFIVNTINAPTGDYRDWDQIHQWARNIASTLIHGDAAEYRPDHSVDWGA